MTTLLGKPEKSNWPRISFSSRFEKTIAYTWLTLLVFIVLFEFTTAVETTSGPSMHPTIKDGNVLLLLRFPSVLFKIKRGDIIVFKYPFGKEFFAKRVIGLPGETIDIAPGGLVYINGELLVEPYIEVASGAGPEKQTTILAAGCYFVMGDNRVNSNDSRYFGPVCKDIYGKMEFFLKPKGKALTTPYRSMPFFVNPAEH